MSTNLDHQGLFTQYLGELVDFSNFGAFALARFIALKCDEAPQLSSRRKGKKIYAKLNGIGFVFSRRGESIAVESMDFPELMVRGLLSKDSSIAEIHRLFEP